ncbi:putative outer membrane repeat protein [Tahibacter aquaticus]|uniref:Putative outer membrane repeat protein n=1 Tax=Tahibacter aquaticus TaxID=520092 RepID=A0A4R6YQP5_9GAMM|nr:choice-of-anchor Q domain-containing protein [Tahibacter aquaticus]TDR40323.1 putative outer membrane repeat protein [Tahibacter aquaticus]
MQYLYLRRHEGAVCSRMRVLFALGTGLAMALPVAATAASFAVANLNDSGSGSLRDAIDQANRTSGADNVTFNSGLSGTITLSSGEIAIFDALTLDGPGASRLTLSGANTSRIFRIGPQAGTPDVFATSISGLSFSSGSSADEGGAIFVDDSNLTVTDCVFRNNAAQRGGGLYAFPSASTTLNLRRTRFENNMANADGGGFGAQDIDAVTLDAVTASGNSAGKNGGGGFVRGVNVSVVDSEFRGNTDSTLPPGIGGISGGAGLRLDGSKPTATMTISDSRFVGNTSQRGQGGALWLSAVPPETLPIVATVVLDRLQLSSNSAELGGGGIYGNNINASLSDSSLSANTAQQAGGGLAWQSSGSLSLVNATLSGNSSVLGSGGGIYSSSATALALASSTLAGNTAGSSGGGIRRDGSSASLRNSIVANNTAGSGADLSGSFAPNYSLIKNNSGASLTAGSGNLATGTDPLLGGLDIYGGPTLSLLPAAGSPVLNVGDPAGSGLPGKDQRGLVRIAAGRVDIGAVERQLPEEMIFRNGLQ